MDTVARRHPAKRLRGEGDVAGEPEQNLGARLRHDLEVDDAQPITGPALGQGQSRRGQPAHVAQQGVGAGDVGSRHAFRISE